MAVFVDAAISFAKEQRWVQQAKEAIVEQDRASHPGMRSISPQARARVHELFDELELNVIDGVVSIHRAFGPGAAARLDNAVMNGFGSIATAASPSALHFPPPSKVSEEPILSGQRRLGALTSINPKFTDPVEDYCTNLTPDEEQYDEDECYNEGAVYDLENCECSIPLVNGGGGGGGGGGSSTGDPSPFIRSITPDTWMAGETQSVTIGGLYFGTNEPTLGFTPGSGISYVVSSYSDFQIVASIKVSNSTPSEIVGLTVTNNGYGGSAFFGGSGGASPQSNQSSATIQAAPPPSSYTIAYNAYIPADHITGPGKCTYNSNQYNFIYKGDGGYNSYRVTETADLNTTTWAGTNFFPMTGQTRQYGYGSPVSGFNLSMLDEDGIASDCHLWNQTSQAPYSNFTYSAASISTVAGSIKFKGSASNPLETSLAAISWTMTTTINITNPSVPTADVNYNHTCYPAHQVKVGPKNTVVYSYTPPSSSLTYLTACLAIGVSSLTNITGETGWVPFN